MPFIASIGAFLPGLFGKEISYKLAKVLGIAALILIALLTLGIGKWAYDRSIINKHDTEERALAAKAQLEADREANRQAAEDAARLAQENHDLEAAASEAARTDPAGAKKPVGPVSQSYYDTLRKKKESKP